MKAEGVSVDLDFYCQCRDGLFDDDEMYAVWTKDDVNQLIDRLKKCL